MVADKPHYTVEQVAAALRETRGLLSYAAERLGCHPTTVTAYVRRHPTLQQVIEESRMRRVDVAELKFDQAIQNGEAWAIAMALKTLGKDRGYVERQEVTGADGGDLRIKVEYVDPDG